MVAKRRHTQRRRSQRRRTGTRSIERARATPTRPKSSGDTIGAWLRFLGAELDDPDWFPVWPPDAFAFAAALLRRTGAYVGLVNGAYTKHLERSDADDHPVAVGERWRSRLEAVLREGKSDGGLRGSCPSQIKGWWSRLQQVRDFGLEICNRDPSVSPPP